MQKILQFVLTQTLIALLLSSGLHTTSASATNVDKLYVNSSWTSESCGGHSWSVDAFSTFSAAASKVTSEVTEVNFEGTFNSQTSQETASFKNSGTGVLVFSTNGAVTSSDPEKCLGTVFKLGTASDTPSLFDEASSEKFELKSGSDLTVFQFNTEKYSNVLFSINGAMKTQSSYYTKAGSRTDIADGASLTLDGSIRPSANGTGFYSYGTTNVLGTLNLNVNEINSDKRIKIGYSSYQNNNAQLNVDGGTVTVRGVASASPSWESFDDSNPAVIKIFACYNKIEGDEAASLNVINGGLFDTSGSIENEGTITIDAKSNAGSRISQIKCKNLTNSGTIIVDMTGATADSYTLIDASETSDYGTYDFATGKANGYTLAVENNDLKAVKNAASVTDGSTTTSYATLTEAISEATSGQTIKLLRDYTQNTAFTINDGVTFDTEDKKLTTQNGWTLATGSMTKTNAIVGEDLTAMAKVGTVNGAVYASSGTLDLRGVDLRLKGEPLLYGGTPESPETLDSLKATRIFFGDTHGGGNSQTINNIVLENCTTAYRAALGVYYDELTVGTVSVNAAEGWYWDQQYQDYNYQMYTGFNGTLNINTSLTTGEYMNAGYSTGGTGITNLAQGAVLNCLDFQNTGNSQSGVTAEQAAQNIADGKVHVNGSGATLNATALNNHAVTSFGTVNLTAHSVHTTASGGLYSVNYGTGAVLSIGTLNFLQGGLTNKHQLRLGDDATTTIGGLTSDAGVGADLYVTQTSETTINKDGGSVVNFTGDIVFTTYANATSDGAKVSIKLDSSDDYFTGSVRGTTSSKNRWGKWGSAIMGDETASTDNIKGMTIAMSNESVWNMTGNSVVNNLTVSASKINGADYNLTIPESGTLNIDAAGAVTLNSFANSGTITVDMTGATEGSYTLINASAASTYGAEGTNYKFAEGKANGYELKVVGNNLVASKFNVTVTEACYATFYSDKKLVVPGGVKVFGYAFDNTTGTLIPTEISQGSILPANKGYVVKAAPGNYAFDISTEDAGAFDSVLSGVLVDTSTEGYVGTIYVLGTIDGKTTFYKYTDTILPAGKAFYLKTED